MGLFKSIKEMFTKSSSKQEASASVEFSAKISSSVSEINPVYLKPLDNGLYPGEVILMDWLNGKSESDKFPGYFEFGYGINPMNSRAELVSNGYLREEKGLSAIPSLKVNELKDILRTKELKISGKKVELIDRINKNFTSDEVEPFVDGVSYSLTDKGKNLLEELYYIVPAHKLGSKDNVYDVASAIQYVNSLSGGEKPNNNQISWALFQKAYIKYKSENSYGLMRNVVHSMAAQLQRENNQERSFIFYLKIFILDLSGTSNSDYLESPKLLTLAPGIISRIKTLESNLKSDDTQRYFEEAWEDIIEEIPFHYFEKGVVFEYLLTSLRIGDDELQSLNTKIINHGTEIFNNINPKEFEEKYKLKYPYWSKNNF